MKPHIKQAFEALPQVDKIWDTEDGHFHLHPHKGGIEVNRDEMDEEENDEVIRAPKEIIALINEAEDEAGVIAVVNGDKRRAVKEAAAKKIASF